MAMDEQRLPRLLSADEVSKQTGLPRARIYELVRSDAIPHVRLGRTVRFSADALLDWIEAGGTGYDGPKS